MACKSPDFRCRPKPQHICNFDELAVLLDAQGTNISTLCMTDDNGQFLRHYLYISGVLDSYFDTDEDGVAYVTSGTVSQCGAETAVTITPNYQLLNGAGSYNLPVNAVSVTIDVIADAGGPTLDTGAGALALVAGQTLTFTSPNGEVLDNTTFAVTTLAGDTVSIYSLLSS